MKKNVNVSVNVAESINESAKTKGSKVGKSENSMNVAPTRKETKLDFISFMVGKEQISVSKFFKLFNEFRNDFPQRYSNYVTAHNLNLNETYNFSWFSANCPRIAISCCVTGISNNSRNATPVATSKAADEESPAPSGKSPKNTKSAPCCKE